MSHLDYELNKEYRQRKEADADKARQVNDAQKVKTMPRYVSRIIPAGALLVLLGNHITNTQ